MEKKISEKIRVKWNDSYLTWSVFNEKNTIDKETFVQTTLSIVDRIRKLLYVAELSLSKYDKKEYNFEKLSNVLRRDYEQATALYSEGAHVGISPYECKNVSQKFQSMIAFSHNVYIFFGGIVLDNDRTEENIILNIRIQLKSFKEAEVKFQIAMNEVQ